MITGHHVRRPLVLLGAGDGALATGFQHRSNTLPSGSPMVVCRSSILSRQD
jgi:hypothetical protein